MRYCPFCANEVEAAEQTCPFCGKPLPIARDLALQSRQQDAAPITVAASAPFGDAEAQTNAQTILRANGASGRLVEPDATRAYGSLDPDATEALIVPQLAQGPQPTASYVSLEAPAIPTTVSPAIERAKKLEAMPSAPVNALGAVPYAIAVLRLRQTIKSITNELLAEIRQQDQALEDEFRDLGRAVANTTVKPACASDGLETLAMLEQQKQLTEQSQAATDDEQAQAEQRFTAQEAEARQTVDGLASQVSDQAKALESARQALDKLKSEHSVLDGQARTLKKEAERRQAQAKKHQDPAEREVALRAAAEVKVELQTIDEQREALGKQMRLAQEQVEGARAQLDAASNAQSSAKAELSRVQSELRVARQALATQRHEQGLQASQIEREIATQLVAIGMIVDGERQSCASFAEHFGNIDARRRNIADRRNVVAGLERQRESVDKGALSRGWLIIGGAISFVLLIIVLLAALL
jgi:hypothetical protein